VICVGGIVNRFHTAASLPESAAAASPDLERLLIAAITGMLACSQGADPQGPPRAAR
jgi:hypothetical protein